MDAEVGAFLGSLEKSGLLENTWVVITADHGEHFGDHDQFGHGSSLYNEMTHVPLVLDSTPRLRRARSRPGQRLARPAHRRAGIRSAICRGRSAALLGSSKQQPISRPQPGALLDEPRRPRRRPPCSLSSKTRASAAKASGPRMS